MSSASITSITAQPISSNANIAKLTRFLRTKLEAGVRRVDLVQISDDHEGTREGRVDTWKVGERLATPADLAHEIEEVARGDSTALGGVNAYALLAYSESGEVFARLGLRVQADSQTGNIVPTERATLLGMRAQEMRHNEMYAQLSARVSLEQIESYRELVNDYRTELANTRKELATAQTKRIEVVELYESLASEKAQRDLAAQREARTDRMQGEILAKVTTLWPLVMHKLAGAKGVSFAPGAQDLLSHLLKNITREEVVRMAQQLPAEKSVVLWEVLAQLLPPDPSAAPPATPPPATPPANEAKP